MYTTLFSDDCLAHHGIQGQKWGVRRYQNPDGTRTAAGKKRYSSERGGIYGDAESISDAAKIQKRNADFRTANRIASTIALGASAVGMAAFASMPITAIGLMGGLVAGGQAAVTTLLPAAFGKMVASGLGGVAAITIGGAGAGVARERYLSAKGYDTTALRTRSNN